METKFKKAYRILVCCKRSNTHLPNTLLGDDSPPRLKSGHRLLPYELVRERRVNGGRQGPPGCHGRLPLRSLIIARRFRKCISQNH